MLRKSWEQWINGTFCKGVFGPEKSLSHVGIWGKICLLLKGIVWLMKSEEREERRTGASGTWRHFWRKDQRRRGIRGPKQRPVWGMPSKGPITVHYGSVLVEKWSIKPNCNTLPYFYRIKTSPIVLQSWYVPNGGKLSKLTHLFEKPSYSLNIVFCNYNYYNAINRFWKNKNKLL